MQSRFSKPLDSINLPKHFSSHPLLRKHVFRTKLSSKKSSFVKIKHNRLTLTACKASDSDSVASSLSSSTNSGEDAESTQLFEKLKEAERQRFNKLEELDRKANVQLERQLVMASGWSRALLSMCGKLKGTEWDPENLHRIDFSDFSKLLNSNNVQFMEYLNYGQPVSVILPYYKDEKMESKEGNYLSAPRGGPCAH